MPSLPPLKTIKSSNETDKRDNLSRIADGTTTLSSSSSPRFCTDLSFCCVRVPRMPLCLFAVFRELPPVPSLYRRPALFLPTPLCSSPTAPWPRRAAGGYAICGDGSDRAQIVTQIAGPLRIILSPLRPRDQGNSLNTTG